MAASSSTSNAPGWNGTPKNRRASAFSSRCWARSITITPSWTAAAWRRRWTAPARPRSILHPGADQRQWRDLLLVRRRPGSARIGGGNGVHRQLPRPPDDPHAHELYGLVLLTPLPEDKKPAWQAGFFHASWPRLTS